jgi:hypothetical protein
MLTSMHDGSLPLAGDLELSGDTSYEMLHPSITISSRPCDGTARLLELYVDAVEITIGSQYWHRARSPVDVDRWMTQLWRPTCEG